MILSHHLTVSKPTKAGPRGRLTAEAQGRGWGKGSRDGSWEMGVADTTANTRVRLPRHGGLGAHSKRKGQRHEHAEADATVWLAGGKRGLYWGIAMYGLYEGRGTTVPRGGE